MTFSLLGDLGNPFLSTLIGAVTGAIVGGLISWMIQRAGSEAVRLERLATKHQEDLADALTLTFKAVKVFSGIQIIRSVLLEAVERRTRPGFVGKHAWQALMPFATLPSKVKVVRREAAFLMSTKNSALIVSAMELADLYNNLLETARVYSELRSDLTMNLPAEFLDAFIADKTLTEAEWRKMAPQGIALDMLFDGLVSRIDADYAQAIQVFDLLTAHCTRNFRGDYIKLELTGLQDPTPPLT